MRAARSRRPPTRGIRLGVLALAGWLFADLLLVLALVSLSDQPDPLAAESARPSPSPSAHPTTRGPSPSPSPTAPPAVAKEPVKWHIEGREKRRLLAQLRAHAARSEGREAAMVLTFGGSTGGTTFAHRVNELLDEAAPKMFTEDTATEDFHDLSEPANTAELWVYFYTVPR